MGNRSSAPTVAENVAGSAAGGEEDGGVVSSSGVFLADDLQAEIVQKFKNQNIQMQYRTLQQSILNQNNKRQAQDELHSIQINEALNEWKKNNDFVQKQLDDKIDSLRATFVDREFALSHDVGNLEKRFDQVPKFGAKDDSCLDIRRDLVSCYKSKNDGRECDAFVELMEQCAKQTIITS